MDPTLLIGDVLERDISSIKSVEFPTPKTSAAGFPQHKRRWKSSASKQQRSAADSQAETRSEADGSRSSAQGATPQPGPEEVERMRIDQENRQKMASMSPQEIAQAQDDIMQGLNPALVQRLLRRANIDDQIESSPFDPHASEQNEKTLALPEVKVDDAVAQGPNPAPRVKDPLASDPVDEDRAPVRIPADLFPITKQPKATHFPSPPSLPDMDPSDPNFLATLHEKYFPSLPADPSKLAWMAPVPSKDSPADKESPYYPHAEIGVSALRFDFRGRFLSPRVSRSTPSTRGLHHHGEAPEAAGYTVAELARLARSVVPAQRCVAYQTLGRILYRLGHGEWGKTEDDPIAMGVWNSMKQGRVLESLLEAAAGESGHRGSRAYATEALWLFEKGGWKEKHKGR
ncbi:hypothetical protein G6O67_001260 [Ophiocordyceps sinensis]|uniref:Transcription factor Rba50 n=1 Tax=Ophiocordyceps sinensis TaxID=72228 RepID=A0A8H4PX88_9HYPO|nr:hypothetical protein G6O67_001260 [Ophiocordyceps sinensis]